MSPEHEVALKVFESSGQSSSSASPPDCEFGIKVQMQMSQYNFVNDPNHTEVPVRASAWRMRITVVEVNNLDPEIFVYNLGDLDPSAGIKRKLFQNVASPVDLVEYPIGEPLDGQSPQFFRLASVDMVHRSLQVLESTWEDIKSDIDELIDALVRLCELETKETFESGTLAQDQDENDTIPAPDSGSMSMGGSEAVECPDDDVTAIVVVESTDPEFPLGAIFIPVGVIDEDCKRTWITTGVVHGYVLTLTTSLVVHTTNFVIATLPEVQGAAGLSDAYGAVLSYAYDPTQEHTLRIAGV